MTRVYVLLGGLIGYDGWFLNWGMYGLAAQLRALPNTQVSTHFWSSWQSVLADIKRQPKETKIAIVGYSGGGSRATWIALGAGFKQIDLLIGYDPSPISDVRPILGTIGGVKRAICYYNETPMMLGLGGGIYTGPNVEVVKIREQHMLVQSDQALHKRTLDEVRSL